MEFKLDAAQQATNKLMVDTLNKSLAKGKNVKNPGELKKDDFLKILIAQLRYQDPLKPMEDKAFIAQMAQFSTLEQITNMNRGFQKLGRTLSSNQALNLLGKKVEINDQKKVITGHVSSVQNNGNNAQVEVNGRLYSVDLISKVEGR